MSKSYAHEGFLILDQGLNVFLFGGYADETISARCYRLGVKDERANTWGRWRAGQAVVDWMFWPQDWLIARRSGSWPAVRHCQRSFGAELARLHLPPEYRQ